MQMPKVLDLFVSLPVRLRAILSTHKNILKGGGDRNFVEFSMRVKLSGRGRLDNPKLTAQSGQV
jgi:hypothetical protein